MYQRTARHAKKFCRCGDTHAGDWHRQVSLLGQSEINDFKARGAKFEAGAFGENIIAEGFTFKKLPIGTRLKCGEVFFEITQIGKECHNHCAIYQQIGDCIMPREGVFARVLHGGKSSRLGRDKRFVEVGSGGKCWRHFIGGKSLKFFPTNFQTGNGKFSPQ